MYNLNMKKKSPEEKMVPVQVYLPDEVYFGLKSEAVRREVTMSKIAREILGIEKPDKSFRLKLIKKEE